MSIDVLENHLWLLALAWSSGLRVAWSMLDAMLDADLRCHRIRAQA